MSTTPAATPFAVAKSERLIEFIPMGNADKIKLSIQIVRDFICIPTKSGKLCSDRDAMRFMMLCQARKLNPFEGDCYLQGYDAQDGPVFSLITAHQAFTKRAETDASYDGMESGVIVLTEDGEIKEREGDFYQDGETVVGGWARVHKKNRKFPATRRLRLSTFRKRTKIWDENPEGMIVKCTEVDALRASFPTLCGNLYTEAEIVLDDDARLNRAKPASVVKPNFAAMSGQHLAALPAADPQPVPFTQDPADELDMRPPAPVQMPAPAPPHPVIGERKPRAAKAAAPAPVADPQERNMALEAFRDIISGRGIQEPILVRVLQKGGHLEAGKTLQEATPEQIGDYMANMEEIVRLVKAELRGGAA